MKNSAGRPLTHAASPAHPVLNPQRLVRMLPVVPGWWASLVALGDSLGALKTYPGAGKLEKSPAYNTFPVRCMRLIKAFPHDF